MDISVRSTGGTDMSNAMVAQRGCKKQPAAKRGRPEEGGLSINGPHCAGLV